MKTTRYTVESQQVGSRTWVDEADFGSIAPARRSLKKIKKEAAGQKVKFRILKEVHIVVVVT